MVKEKKILTDEEKKEKKEKRKRVAKIVILCIFTVVLLFTLVTTVIMFVSRKANLKRAESFENAGCAELKLDNYADGCWNIITDDELRVMQLTDVHLGAGWMSAGKDAKALNAVAAMITAEKPDLVIVTGDLAYPIFMQTGTINNKAGAELFATLMESLGVYWTMSFGNHDVESNSLYSKEDIVDFYSQYPHCLLQKGPDDIDGIGNQVINVVDSNNVITRSFILLDSHAYADGHIPVISSKYDNIHENQISWYKKTVEELNAKNKSAISALPSEVAEKYAEKYPVVKTSLFFHIPVAEFADAWDEFSENDFKDTENVKFFYGVQDEKVCCSPTDDEVFETVLEMGSTDSIFCGHDHVNTYSVDYKGVRLTYGMSIDYLAYIGISKKGSQRGCTVITYSDGGFDCTAENYYQDKYVTLYEKEDNVKL